MSNNQSTLDITDPLAFTNELNTIYNEKGIDAFVVWINAELSDGRKVKVLSAAKKQVEKIIFDKSISVLENNKPGDKVLPFKREENPETSTLLGVYNLLNNQENLQIQIRVYRDDDSSVKEAVKAIE